MSDVAKFLPLSQRGSEDESSVSNNWSEHLSSALERLADALATVDHAALERQAAQPGYRVRDTVGHLLFMVHNSRTARLRAIATTALKSRVSRSQALRTLSGSAGEGSVPQLVSRLRDAARLEPGRRGSLAELSAAVVDSYDIAAHAPLTLTIDPIASGAVALAQSLTAPIAVRAVLADRTLHAVDADWYVGRGATLQSDAAPIVLFLWERGPVPPATSAEATESAPPVVSE